MRTWLNRACRQRAPAALGLVALVSGCALFGYDFDGYQRAPGGKGGVRLLHPTWVGGAVAGERGGIELRGHLGWHGSVSGTSGAVHLDGSVR